MQVIPVGTRSLDGAFEQHEYIILGAEPYSGVAKLLPETTKSDKQTDLPALVSFWTVNSEEGEAQVCHPAKHLCHSWRHEHRLAMTLKGVNQAATKTPSLQTSCALHSARQAQLCSLLLGDRILPPQKDSTPPNLK